MLILLNLISAVMVLAYAATCGWLGESIQYRFVNELQPNMVYDRELLMVLALIQSGSGTARFSSDGFIYLNTDLHDLAVYGSDYADPKFGVCYRYRKDGYTHHIKGGISLSTRRYLLDFKENYLEIRDPISVQPKLFKFKKEKVTIE